MLEPRQMVGSLGRCGARSRKDQLCQEIFPVGVDVVVVACLPPPAPRFVFVGYASALCRIEEQLRHDDHRAHPVRDRARAPNSSRMHSDRARRDGYFVSPTRLRTTAPRSTASRLHSTSPTTRTPRSSSSSTRPRLKRLHLARTSRDFGRALMPRRNVRLPRRNAPRGSICSVTPQCRKRPRSAPRTGS